MYRPERVTVRLGGSCVRVALLASLVGALLPFIVLDSVQNNRLYYSSYLVGVGSIVLVGLLIIPLVYAFAIGLGPLGLALTVAWLHILYSKHAPGGSPALTVLGLLFVLASVRRGEPLLDFLYEGLPFYFRLSPYLLLTSIIFLLNKINIFYIILSYITLLLALNNMRTMKGDIVSALLSATPATGIALLIYASHAPLPIGECEGIKISQRIAILNDNIRRKTRLLHGYKHLLCASGTATIPETNTRTIIILGKTDIINADHKIVISETGIQNPADLERVISERLRDIRIAVGDNQDVALSMLSFVLSRLSGRILIDLCDAKTDLVSSIIRLSLERGDIAIRLCSPEPILSRRLLVGPGTALLVSTADRLSLVAILSDILRLPEQYVRDILGALSPRTGLLYPDCGGRMSLIYIA